jgi:dihydrolipoamide dehydrogenase
MYDIVIIGSGPAGHTAALEAAKHKFKTAVIERDAFKFGGVCLNEGCIPLKGLLYYSIHEKDFGSIRGKVMFKVGLIKEGLRSRVIAAGVEIIQGEAKFVSPFGIEVSGKRIQAKNFIIAAGSSPKKIYKDAAVLSPEKIFELDKAPKNVLIIGGGVIGCEYASFLNNMGSEVSIVELMDTILFGEDEEAVRTLEREFKKKKIKLYEKSEIISIGADRTVAIKTGEALSSERYDMIFEAIGRKPNTAELGLEAAGVVMDGRGFIKTDSCMRTNVKNIYAIGDCAPTPMLAYTAAMEAQKAVLDCAGIQGKPIDYENMPKLVFSCPQLGSAGISEKKAKEKNINIKIYKYFFKAIGKAVVEGQDAGFLKLIADTDNDIIIGAAAAGSELTDIINELSVIIKAKVKISVLKECMHIHPSYSEIILEALNS